MLRQVLNRGYTRNRDFAGVWAISIRGGVRHAIIRIIDGNSMNEDAAGIIGRIPYRLALAGGWTDHRYSGPCKGKSTLTTVGQELSSPLEGEERSRR
jgi:hypothetical protein